MPPSAIYNTQLSPSEWLLLPKSVEVPCWVALAKPLRKNNISGILFSWGSFLPCFVFLLSRSSEHVWPSWEALMFLCKERDVRCSGKYWFICCSYWSWNAGESSTVFFKCVSSQHTFKGTFYRLTRHHALCQVLLSLSPADSSQKPYEVDTVIIAPILLSRKLRLREVHRLAQVLLASERWS